MRVHNRLNIGAGAIDQQVHADFAGYVAPPRHLLSVQVDDDHVGGPHGAFADARGSYQHTVAPEPHREIAVHGGHEPVFMEHATVAHDFFPMLAFRRHDYPCMVARGRDDKKAARNRAPA